MFIGIYSIANFITLMGLTSSVVACFLAGIGSFKFALFMLFLACLCDTFDGRVARSNLNRTEKQKFYGIQLDSLCDLVSFGVTPCFIAFSFGFRGALDIIIYCLFIVCGAIRLAYFNTLANEPSANPKKNKGFRGVPIPMSCPLMTLLFMLTLFTPANVSVWFFRIGMLALAIGYVLNIKIKKPSLKRTAIFTAVQVVLLLIILIAGDFKLPTPPSA